MNAARLATGPNDDIGGSGAEPLRFVRRTLPLAEELRRLPSFVRNYAEDSLHHFRTHGDVFHRRVGVPSLHICHPRLVQRVLRANVRNYPKGPDYDLLRPIIGNGIIVSEGELWARQRRLLAPEFRLKEVTRFLPVINAELERLFGEWDEGALVDVSASMMHLAIRVLGGAIFQSDFSDKAQKISEAIEICLAQATRQMMSMGLLRSWMPTPGNRRARAAERRLNHIVRHLISDEHSAHGHRSCPVDPVAGAEQGVDMLSRMLCARDEDSGRHMSERQLIDEVKSLILAGHETTGLSLSWALYLLSRHPEVEARLLDEARAVLGDRPARASDVPRLVYTRQVLLETMRLYPPVPGVTRRALVDDLVDGVTVRAGESVTIMPYVVHRHPEFWPQPERFDPDRFAPERAEDIDPYSYIPFMRGRRACLGEHFAMLEGVVTLASMVRRFELSRVDDGDIEARPITTLRMARPLLMRVGRRP